MIKRLLVGVSFLMLGAFGLQAQSSTQSGSQSGMQTSSSQQQQQLSSTDRDFVKNAYESNMKEIQISELAAQRSSSNEVKQFAQQMVDDHRTANDQLKEIADSKGIDLPSDIQSPEQEQFSNLSGNEFDRQYVENQRSAHQQAISLYQNQANRGSDPELKSFASNQLDKLRQHESMVTNLQASLSSTPQAQGRAEQSEESTMTGSESQRSEEQRRSTTTTTTTESEQREMQEAQQLPRTASNMPLVGLFGLLLVGAALMVRYFRLVRNQ